MSKYQTTEDYVRLLNGFVKYQKLTTFYTPHSPVILDLAGKPPWDHWCFEATRLNLRNLLTSIDSLRTFLILVVSSAYLLSGAHVCWLNDQQAYKSVKISIQIQELIHICPFEGWTEIGEALYHKVVEPLILKPARRGALAKPWIVMIITEGEFSHVGNNAEAINFLRSLDADSDIGKLNLSSMHMMKIKELVSQPQIPMSARLGSWGRRLPVQCSQINNPALPFLQLWKSSQWTKLSQARCLLEYQSTQKQRLSVDFSSYPKSLTPRFLQYPGNIGQLYMSTNDDLVRYLQSAAFLATPENITYYAHSDNGNLTEKAFDGAEWSLPTLITKVPDGTPAVYVQGRFKRGLIIVHDGLLKNFLYNEDEDEWEAGSLQAANITVNYDSRIAAGITQTEEFCIVYEDQDGDLSTASSIDGFEWVKKGKYFTDAKLLDGSALWYTRQEEGTAYLFYQNIDGSIHYVEEVVSKPVADQKAPYGDINDGEKIARILATTPENIYYLTSNGKIFQVTPESKTQLGCVDESGNFKASTSAEFFLVAARFRARRPVHQNITITNININQTTITNNYYGTRNPWITA
ncbi:hypothetical protein L211DRAFT_847033 [Terfezia boudieri ATCC MYA-4762]|uniref:Fucose-specific lectin n=1 Tax=Terfezia boudieri ATCC MYA-4762 TaxID=1051890 RepID=A0A3N4LZ81_9PEZI|nr:hypothetical protein L211DRAFT_847033 [Terfezia boudieri ATCC MYA-4762]